MNFLDLIQKQYCCLTFILWLLLLSALWVDFGNDGKMIPINFTGVLFFMHMLKRSVFSLLDNINQTLPSNEVYIMQDVLNCCSWRRGISSKMCRWHLVIARLALCLLGGLWWQSSVITSPTFWRSLCLQYLFPPVLSLQLVNLHSICYWKMTRERNMMTWN